MPIIDKHREWLIVEVPASKYCMFQGNVIQNGEFSTYNSWNKAKLSVKFFCKDSDVYDYVPAGESDSDNLCPQLQPVDEAVCADWDARNIERFS